MLFHIIRNNIAFSFLILFAAVNTSIPISQREGNDSDKLGRKLLNNIMLNVGKQFVMDFVFILEQLSIL